MSVEAFLELPASPSTSSTVHRCMDKKYLLSEHEYWLQDQFNLEELHCSFIGLEITSTTPPSAAVAAAACSTSSNNTEVELIVKNLTTLSALSSSIDQVLDGKFLLCRTIAPPIKMTTALTTVVDDPEGIMAAKLALQNYDKSVGSTCSLEQCNLILPVGTILAIKNPLLKLPMEDGGGEMGIRCNNSTNVVIMDEEALEKLNPDLKWNGEIPSEYITFMKKTSKVEEVEVDTKTAEAETCKFYRAFGDTFFARGEFAVAIRSYTCGLIESQHEDSVLLSHRATAYNIIGKFQEALADAEKLLELDPAHEIGIVAKTRALWGLKRFVAAKEYLETQILPTIEYEYEINIQSYLLKAEELLSQATTGNYPKEIHQISNQFSSRPRDWADFEGEIMVQDTGDGRGRGLYAKKDIAAGDLILASKAFAYVVTNQIRPSNYRLSEMNSPTTARQRYFQITSAMENVLKQNPDMGKILYKLYAGPELRFLSEDHPASTFIDMSRIDGIYKYNTFGHTSPLNDYVTTGIWIQPSFINHSCIDCNSFSTMYGDFLFVRAFKEIKAGEEILMPYMSPTEPYFRRRVGFANYGFECYCRLCLYDRQLSVELRNAQFELLLKLGSLPLKMWDKRGKYCFRKHSLRLALHLIERFLEIRPKYQHPIVPFLTLLPFNQSINTRLRALPYLKKCFEILNGSPLLPELFEMSGRVTCCLLKLGRREEFEEWCAITREVMIKTYGTIVFGF